MEIEPTTIALHSHATTASLLSWYRAVLLTLTAFLLDSVSNPIFLSVTIQPHIILPVLFKCTPYHVRNGNITMKKKTSLKL